MNRNLVIVPVYNEQFTIRAVICELCRHHQGDVLLIDDGSTDASLERIEDCATDCVTVLRHPENQGYGMTLIDGFQYAIENNYDAAVTIDCDCQHSPRQVPEFFAQLNGFDLLSGSRYLESSPHDQAAPPDRCRINGILTERLNKLTDFCLTDAFCGFKAYRVSALKRLQLDEPGYAMPLQLWVQASVFRLQVKEIPVTRIYMNLNRSFGAELDDPETRLRLYEKIIDREMKRWQQIS